MKNNFIVFKTTVIAIFLLVKYLQTTVQHIRCTHLLIDQINNFTKIIRTWIFNISVRVCVIIELLTDVWVE